jgi:transketolase
VPGLGGRFEMGRLELLGDGGDLLIVTMGAIAVEAAEAARLLAERGIRCRLAVVASVSPAPIEQLASLLAQHSIALTVESHYVAGGLGSMVSEIIAEGGFGCRLARCGVRSTPTGVSGSVAYMHTVHGLSAEAVAAAGEQAVTASHTGSFHPVRGGR